ncbi:MAG TPA: TetR/AcrR family transcriptional regulator [Alphaproteobacteria bacterium]|nr:TetR/AcrR family transcriptional regulator [Alphaproteobacteria bacterium]
MTGQRNGSKRQPGATRKRLLDVAGELAVEAGVSALTLEAVAARAGVSKGGLLHHFPSKNALVAGMVEDLIAHFVEATEKEAAGDPEPSGRAARAYLRAVAAEGKEGAQRWGAVASAFLLDQALMKLWRDEMDRLRERDLREEDADPVATMIVRLAADGLWLADLFDLYGLDEAMRGKILDRLADLTRNTRPPG